MSDHIKQIFKEASYKLYPLARISKHLDEQKHLSHPNLNISQSYGCTDSVIEQSDK